MRKLIIMIAILGAGAAYLCSNAVNTIKTAQHAQVSALSLADQNN